MEIINENIFHLYNKWKEGYVRKETALEEKIKPMMEWAKEAFEEEDFDKMDFDAEGITMNGKLEIDDYCLVNGELPYPFVKCNKLQVMNNTHINTMKNFPMEVAGEFVCRHTYISSLEGCPQKVGKHISLNFSKSLTSLKGLPKKNISNLNIRFCSITSLEGCSEEISHSFECSYCTSLTSLVGAPKKVKEHFYCDNCDGLTSLVGAPEIVKGGFDCSHCASLTSLKGAPEEVKYFDCINCTSLTSLVGAPKKVENFNCEGCISLTSLEGLPKELTGTLRLPLELKNLDLPEYASKYKILYEYTPRL